MSLRLRFALWIGGVSVAIITFVAIASFQVLGAFLEQGATQRLESIADRIEVEIEDDGSVEVEDDLPADVHYRVIVAGRVRAVSNSFPEAPIIVDGAYGEWDDHLVLSVEGSEDGKRYVLQLATNATGIRAPLAAYVRAMTWILPITVLFLAVISWFLAGRFTAPLAALQRSASAVRDEGDLRTVLPGKERSDEIGQLAQTLQDAFERLARAIEREQTFTRAAAHDLRSPLAAVRTRIQAVLAKPRALEEYKQSLREIDVDVERLSTLTNHLLLLARDPRDVALERVNLSPIVAAAVERGRRAAPDVDIDLRAPAEAWIMADSLLAATLVQNLVDNAVRHGAGAAVTISLERVTDQAVELRVQDQGPGVEQEVLHRLGEPFFQEDASRSRGGSGLGLSVVKRLMSIMQGAVRFESDPGHGFVAIVRWREAPAQA